MVTLHMEGESFLVQSFPVRSPPGTLGSHPVTMEVPFHIRSLGIRIRIYLDNLLILADPST